jgi:beta-phosphoglucomutase
MDNPGNNSQWIYRISEFCSADLALNGNRFLLGNGYMGVRGTLEEHGKEEFAGCLLNGVYDQAPGKWREPVNAPNGLFTRIESAGEILSHEQTLDIRHGILSRKTKYENAAVTAERFVSMDNVHLICLKYASTVPVQTFINSDVWDINGPHFQCMEKSENHVLVKTGELGILIAVCTETEWIGGNGFNKYISIYTSLDCDTPLDSARAACRAARQAGYDKLKAAHTVQWKKIWKACDVQIEGDAEAQFALRYSLYQLQLTAPRHSSCLSIPARGLSGQVYKGAVFWDTEMFMTPVFSLTDPAVARNLILYRFQTLDGAKRKAAEYGFQGAFFAWESQETGDDACTDFNVTDVFTNRPMRTHFRDKQIHVSADIVYAVRNYVDQTGDESILADGAAELIAECARFLCSYAYYKKDKGRYELLDVVGPDEYHERVYNNAYTNRIAKFALETAFQILGKQDEKFSDLGNWKEVAEELTIPQPDENGIIPQFDGYEKLEDITLEELKSRILNPTEYLGGGNGLATTTKIIKQADVVLMLNLFPDDWPEEIVRANWEYYEPRTEHGSSLSACAYAMVAARIGRPDWAYNYFMKTATVDLTGNSKQFVGNLYIGGTHPAANGGAWMSAVFGFAGLQAGANGITLNPHLPSHWRGMKFSVMWQGKRYDVKVTQDEMFVSLREIKAVIFDLDGVILSTDDFHYRAWKHLADRENIYFDREINERLRGVSRMESLAIILERAERIYSDVEKTEMAMVKNEFYRESLNRLAPADVFPGVLDLLALLKSKGIRSGIGSSSRNARFILEKVGLQDAFDEVSDGTNITNSKPDPEVFLKAADMLGVAPECCLVVEDADAGVEAAKAAGMTALGIGSAAAHRLADYSAENLRTVDWSILETA